MRYIMVSLNFESASKANFHDSTGTFALQKKISRFPLFSRVMLFLNVKCLVIRDTAISHFFSAEPQNAFDLTSLEPHLLEEHCLKLSVAISHKSDHFLRRCYFFLHCSDLLSSGSAR